MWTGTDVIVWGGASDHRSFHGGAALLQLRRGGPYQPAALPAFTGRAGLRVYLNYPGPGPTFRMVDLDRRRDQDLEVTQLAADDPRRGLEWVGEKLVFSGGAFVSALDPD